MTRVILAVMIEKYTATAGGIRRMTLAESPRVARTNLAWQFREDFPNLKLRSIYGIMSEVRLVSTPAEPLRRHTTEEIHEKLSPAPAPPVEIEVRIKYSQPQQQTLQLKIGACYGPH